MSEEKGAIGRAAGPAGCTICGHSPPWHSMVCPRVSGLYCPECEALSPRHYHWCGIGIRDNWFSWSAPRDIQHEVEQHYNVHMKNRIAQRATGGLDKGGQ